MNFVLLVILVFQVNRHEKSRLRLINSKHSAVAEGRITSQQIILLNKCFCYNFG